MKEKGPLTEKELGLPNLEDNVPFLKFQLRLLENENARLRMMLRDYNDFLLQETTKLIERAEKISL